ncbi:ricin-type beta-trefoil lectin domain protein [Dactylosporangium sp. NBC_01737]|uniref:ricin-type beta-trefoil lectin domain protein n=1 Tax=Dactylosporangium sp. NBC_01737 TaxID=2975959 RepID=UPI002E0D1677|nr:ricin-type beta-trefoil lectin domain protein [Dactylosporangium sp. NBC_01737]
MKLHPALRRSRRGTLSVSIALAATVAAAAGSVAVLAAAAPAAADPAPVNQRTAETTALRQAVESGRPVEVANSKSEAARIMATPRGTLVRESYSTPRWAKKDGAWRDIDLSLRKDGNTIAPVASVVDLRFSAGGAEPLVTLNGDGGALKLSWPSKLPAPRIAGDTAIYEQVFPDIDLQVHSTVEGFGYSLIVKNQQAAANPALAKLKFGLSTTGWTLKPRPGGGYETRDKNGKVTVSAGQALMWDAAGVPGAQRSLAAARTAGKDTLLRHAPDNSRKADLSTTVEGGSLVIVPDAKMLADPNVAYPVVIDPLNTVGKSRTGYTDSTDANRDDSVVRVGQNPDGSGTFRSFFAFDLTWLPGKQVLGAKFGTLMTHSWDCSATPVSLYRTEDLPGNGRQAWDGPDLHVFIETKSGNAHKPSGGTGCPNDPQPNLYMEFSNQTLVNDVIGFGQGRGFYTLGLSTRDSDGTDETAGNRWKKFDQSQTFLSIEYNSLPNTPQASALTTHTDYTAAGQACATGTGRPIVRSTAPWLKANISDPDGDGSGQLSASFALQQQNGSNWTAVGGWPSGDSGVPSGTLAEVQVPAGILTGSVYRWQVQVSDTKGGTSGWSTWCEFTIDTTPPAGEPTVVADDGLYLQSPPNNTMRGSVGRTGQFTFGANGETDIVEYEYQLDGGPKNYVAATTTGGPATVWVTPTHVGEQVLTVRSRDAGQNASPPYDYRFLVNSHSAAKAWKLDEGAGTTAATTPAGGPTATLTGGPVWTEGRVLGTHTTNGKDGGLRFDGVDDLTAAPGPIVDTSQSFSAAAWVRLTGSTASQRTVLCVEGSMACGFAIMYLPAPTNRWALTMYDSDTANAPTVYATAPTPPTFNQWTHLAVSWDKGTKTAKLYVNGNAAGQLSRASNWNATGALLTGAGRWNGVRQPTFLGDISDVQVWPRAIDHFVDIAQTIKPAKVGEWAMEDYDEDAPRQVLDDSNYQRPLTLTEPAGTVTWCDSHDITGLCFDGLTGAATAPAVVRTDQSYSVTAWARITDTNVSRAVFSQQGTRGAAFTVRYDKTANRWSFAATGTDTDAPTVAKVNSLAAPALNTWTELEAIYDGALGKIRFYVNGQLQGEAVVTANWHATGTFNVGRTLQAGAAAEFFAGDVDEVRVYAGALRSAGGAIQTNTMMLVRSGIAGKCLDNAGGQSADGNPVNSYGCNAGYSAQLWTMPGDNTVRINGKCLTAANNGTAPGTLAQLSSCTSGSGQQWEVGSFNSLRNPASGLCLEVTNGSTADGTALRLSACSGTGSAAQQWTMQWSGIGMFRSGLAGKCLDNRNAALVNTNPIQSYDCLGGTYSQIFALLPDNTLRIGTMCVDITSIGTANQSKIQLYTCNGYPNQQWVVGANNTLRNPNSGRCLDVTGQSTANSVQLQIYDCNGLPGQTWYVP